VRDDAGDSIIPPGTLTTPTSGVPWGAREILIGLAAVLILFFILSAAVVFPVVESYGDSSPEALAASAVIVVFWNAGMVFTVYRLVRGRGAGWLELGLRSPLQAPHRVPERKTLAGIPSVNWTAWCIFTGLAASYAAVYVYGIVVNVFDIDALKPDQQIPDEFFDHDWLLPLIGIGVVLTAPISEEIFFRGFIYGAFRKRLSVLPAALFSGALFSCAHLDPGLFIPFALVGAVLANTYERSGTLYAPITVHFLFNLFSFLVLVLVPEARN
jgi:membrane protease YdiL (CAAX protease family)